MQATSFTELPVYYFIICAAILGLLVGSFLNVVILRLPKMMFTSWRQDCEEFLKENKDNPLTKLDKKIQSGIPGFTLPHLQRTNKSLAKYSRYQLFIFTRQMRKL